ncbi:MAG: hypothetical protein ACOC1S_04460 [bacterium]
MKSYKLLCRLIEDQTIETSSELKEDEDSSSDSLQNPHDEDATFRRKGKNLLRVTLLTSVKQQTRTTRYR